MRMQSSYLICCSLRPCCFLYPLRCRYLELLQEGAQHWQLEPAHVQWLASLQGVAGGQRGDAHYTSAGGAPLEALPKVRTGSQPQQRRRGQQQGRGGQRHQAKHRQE